MTTLLLVRHGQHVLPPGTIPGRSAGVHLSDLGRRQVESLAERLAALSPAAVYASPLERTRESATPLAARLGLEVVPNEDLLEVDYGEWSRRTVEELREIDRWRHWNEYRSGTRAPGGESMLDVQARAMRFLERTLEHHPSETIVAFSHGDVVRAAVLYCLGSPLDLILRLEISLASVTTIELNPWGPRVLSVNVT